MEEKNGSQGWRQTLSPATVSGLDDIKDATVLLFGKQGFSNGILRYAKLLSDRGAEVLLKTDRPARSILQVTRPGPNRQTGSTAARFNYHCPLMSLPLVFETTLNNVPREVPWLFCRARKIEKVGEQTRKQIETQSRPCLVRRILSRIGPKAGLRIEREAYRSPNSRVSGTLMPSFTVFKSASQAEASSASYEAVGGVGPRIVDVSDAINDFSDTAALVDNLDLVISVDTSHSAVWDRRAGQAGVGAQSLRYRLAVAARQPVVSDGQPVSSKTARRLGDVIEAVRADLVRATSGASLMPARAFLARRSAGSGAAPESWASRRPPEPAMQSVEQQIDHRRGVERQDLRHRSARRRWSCRADGATPSRGRSR